MVSNPRDGARHTKYDVVVDAALADQSLIASKVLSSKSEMSCNDQLVNEAATHQPHEISVED